MLGVPESFKIRNSFSNSRLIELISEEVSCRVDSATYAHTKTSTASAALNYSESRSELQAENNLRNVGGVQNLCPLGETSGVSVAVGSEYVNVVSLGAGVNFSTKCFEVD
jgi:hypothetical protein